MTLTEQPLLAAEDLPKRYVEVSMPEMTDQRTRVYLRDPEIFVVNSLRKKRVEVKMRDMTDHEKELIKAAKGKVREFIKEEVVTRLLDDEIVPKDQIMRMRWVLTWKKDDTVPGGKKGKARLVVLGFEDIHLGEELSQAVPLSPAETNNFCFKLLSNTTGNFTRVTSPLHSYKADL
jgi:hypothetical protein